jgi:hypothetical protein
MYADGLLCMKDVQVRFVVVSLVCARGRDWIAWRGFS